MDLLNNCKRGTSSSVHTNSVGDNKVVRRNWRRKFSSSPPSSPETILGEFDRDHLELLASKPPTPLILKDMYDYGRATEKQQRLLNAQFLYKELPIRVAQRAVDLLTLPNGLSEAEPIQEVARTYLSYVQQLEQAPMPVSLNDEEAFTDTLRSFILDSDTIPQHIAKGVHIWSQEGKASSAEMEDALYRFFTARVGLRLLVEHFILSSNRESCKSVRNLVSMFPDEDHYTGCIHDDCDVLNEVRRVAEVVSSKTRDFYSQCPAIEIVDCCRTDAQFTQVPHHLHHMFAELLGNSCRAVVEASNKDSKLDPIIVVVSKGDEDVSIKVADKGGGIPRSRMETIWSFAEFSSKSQFAADQTPRGFGLPLARIYARYFGGELTLKSMEGYGLDAYLHLPRLGTNCENLPPRVRQSPGARDSTPTSEE